VTLVEKQRLFTRLYTVMIAWANTQWGHKYGIYVVMFETERSRQAARWNSQHCRICKDERDRPVHGIQALSDYHSFVPMGIAKSLHTQRLAGDLGLFKLRKGKPPLYLTDSADYAPLGEHWEKMHPLCCWGGRFKHPDGGHFSVTHGGRR